MNQKWNLQDIRPAPSRKRRDIPSESIPERTQPPQESSREDAEDVMSIAITNGNKKKNRSLILAVVIFVIILAGGIFASIKMGGTVLTVYPKWRDPNVDATFTAMRTPQPNDLTYEVMTLTATGTKQVTANGQQDVQSKAKGTILVYNKYQTTPVRLIANTRFASPDGLIFRIQAPITVPGYTKDASGTIVPGVTSADVIADQVGETYNMAPAHFTIPGFKGDPEYDGVYGESVATFTGGFAGKKFIIADADLSTAKQSLHTELRNSLLDRIDAEKPAGFVIFKSAVSFTYDSLPSVAYGTNLATISERATMRIPMFKDSEFAAYIATQTIPGYDQAPVIITDPSVLQFAYTATSTAASDISATDSISFTLSGHPQIVWTYDTNKLKTDLMGKNKTALPAVLGAYPAIQRAEADIRPFWQTSFPTNINEMTIKQVIASSTPTGGTTTSTSSVAP